MSDSIMDMYDKQKESNCCGMPVYRDSDICSGCKEHCSSELECENCQGSGTIREDAREFDIDERWRDCPECGSKGWIEI